MEIRAVEDKDKFRFLIYILAFGDLFVTEHLNNVGYTVDS